MRAILLDKNDGICVTEEYVARFVFDRLLQPSETCEKPVVAISPDNLHSRHGLAMGIGNAAVSVGRVQNAEDGRQNILGDQLKWSNLRAVRCTEIFLADFAASIFHVRGSTCTNRSA